MRREERPTLDDWEERRIKLARGSIDKPAGARSGTPEHLGVSTQRETLCANGLD